MLSSRDPSFWRTVAFSLVITIGVGLLTYAEVFRIMNVSLMDSVFAVLPNKLETPPVLLVELGEFEGASQPERSQLLKSIIAEHPRSLNLVINNRADFEIWSQIVSKYQGENTRPVLLTNSALDDSASINLARVQLLGGYHRVWSIDSLSQESQYFPLNYYQPRLPDTPLIDFTMGANYIPKVRGEQILQGSIPALLVRDKHIVVGAAINAGQPGFSVPFSRLNGISSAELQSYVLASAMNDRFISGYNPWLAMLVSALILTSCLLVLQWLEFWGACLVLLSEIIVAVLINYLVIRFYAYPLPVSQWLLVALLALFMVYQQKRRKEQNTLKHLVAEIDAGLAERILPKHFNQTDQPWSQIINFVFQQLNLNKAIFLEKVKNNHRVKEISSIQCDLEGILELRRDYLRPPYLDAIEAGRPVQSFRQYFKNKQDEELEYLAVLSFGGEVLGFWAASLTPGENWNQSAFENNMRAYAEQVAELLYHREHWLKQHAWAENFWVRVFSFETGNRLHTRLKQSVNLLEGRMDTLERVFNCLSTASVVYSVFGQVIHVNKRMERVSAYYDISIFGHTATEALAKISELSLDEAKKKIRYVVRKQQNITIELHSLDKPGQHILHIRPIVADEISNDAVSLPFQVLGILFEFIDVREIRELMSFRKNLMQQYFHNIRNDLATAGMAMRIIAETNDQDKKTQLIGMINQNIAEISKRTTQAEAEVERFTSMYEQSGSTINFTNLVLKVVDEMQETLQAHNIELDLELPQISGLVLGDLGVLLQFLRVAFRLMIEDAIEPSILKVQVKESASNDKMLVSIKDRGHGVDPTFLERSLRQEEQLFVDESDPPLVQIGVLIRQLSQFGAHANLDADLGLGFALEVQLPLYDFTG